MPDIEAIDQGILPWLQLQRQRLPFVARLLEGVETLGEPIGLLMAGLLALGILLWLRGPRALLIGVATLVVAGGLGEGVKYLVRRLPPLMARPVREPPAISSFPSVGVLLATVLYVLLALLVAASLRRTGARRLFVGTCALLVFLIGFSQVFLGIHYMSDVGGAWCCGLALALLASRFASAPAPITAYSAGERGP